MTPAQLAQTVEAQPDRDRWLAVTAVHDTEALHAAVDAAVDRFGKLDVLVSPASGTSSASSPDCRARSCRPPSTT
jgi:NAD(P)-dependent dehydrogenase (short-subunit alcohol dehydrogenase family)